MFVSPLHIIIKNYDEINFNLAGDIFHDVHLNPKNIQEYKENIEKVLKFMQNKSIKMHQTSAKG